MRLITKIAAVAMLAVSAQVSDAQITMGGAAQRVNSAGQQLVSITGIIPTYAASGTFAATTGVLFSICGSATKTVVLRSLQISGTATSVGTLVLNIIKTSSAPTGGTSISITPTAFDTNSSAATATATAYTAAPTAGMAIGTVGAFAQIFPAPTTGGGANQIPGPIVVPQGSQPIILRGTSQCAELQTSSSALTGASLSVSLVWTEESYFPSPSQ